MSGSYSVAVALRSKSSTRRAQYVQKRWPGGPAKTLVRPQVGQVSLASPSTVGEGSSTTAATSAGSTTATVSLGVEPATAGGGGSSGGAAAAAASASSRCRNSRLSQRSTRGYRKTLGRRSQMSPLDGQCRLPFRCEYRGTGHGAQGVA
jgi:hypothetical protein